MKNVKLITMMLFMMVTTISFGQDSIKVTPGGITIAEFKSPHSDNVTHNRVISWVNSTYKNPDKVLTGNVEGESVTISGYKEYAIRWESLGVVGGYGMSYHLYVTIVDSLVNFKCVVDELRNHANYSDKKYISSFYKKDGTVKKMYASWIIEIEETINNLYFSFYEKINDASMTSDEAIAELKKSKDKLDLGLITQEEYDKKKAELSKFIK